MASTKGVQRFLERTAGHHFDIVEMDESTHTAQEAADAVGASVGSIVKSLVFVASGEPVLVLASGANRVDPGLLSETLGSPVDKADADTVKSATGWSIGSVPPFGHPTPLRCVMDKDLLNYDAVWAAAGSPRAVFSLSPQKLLELSGATLATVCE